MAWVRPRRSRAGQEAGVVGNSGGTGGSSLPAGGPAALGGGVWLYAEILASF